MRRRLRLALVGLGTWAQTGHLPVYAGTRLRGRAEVVALCSRDINKAKAWGNRYGIAGAFDDLGHLLEDVAPDVLVVCTPDDLHVEPTVQALAAGCHVLVEKPLATNLDGVRAVRDAAKRHGRKVISLYHKRADPLWAEAAARVATGRYGPLQMGSVLIENPVTVPAGGYFETDMASRTDPNLFLGTHMYDLLRFVTGTDPVRVTAHRYAGRLSEAGVATADGFKADIEMASGASVSVTSAWNLPSSAPALTKQSMLLHFRDGELDLDGTRRGFVEHGSDGFSYVNPYFLRMTPAGPQGYGAAFLEEAVLGLTGDHTGSVSLPTLDDSWWPTAVADAVATSCERGGVCDVVPPPLDSETIA